MHADSTSNNFLKQFSLTYHTHMNVHIHTLTEHTDTHKTQNTTEHITKLPVYEMRHLNRMLLRNEPSQQCTAHM